MASSTSVMPILRVNSGILKIEMILFMSFSGQAAGGLRSYDILARPRFHLISDRPLRRRDNVGGAALGGDLLGGGFRKVVGLHRQLFGHLAGAENAHAVGWAFGQALQFQR